MTNLDNFKQEELITTAAKLSWYTFFCITLSTLVFGAFYWAKWGNNAIKNQPIMFYVWGAFVLIIGTIIHELIHGFTWSLFAEKSLKSIRYGFAWSSFTPYCHCKEPLLVKHYIIGGFMPALILGVIPTILAIFTGNSTLFFLGMIFIYAASGDFMLIDMLRKEPMNSLVQDHPSKIGCYIYRPLNSEEDLSV